MAKDRRSRDQKRKNKLANKSRSSQQAASLAYMGEKYKTDSLMQTWLNVEFGIYEVYVVTDRTLLDRTVVSALDTLIRQMRAGTIPQVAEDAGIHYEVGEEEQFVIRNIRRNLANHYQTEWKPPKDQRIGVLRTILGSIEKVRGPGPDSQSYMHHISGFLTRKLGLKVEAFAQDMTPLPEPEEEEFVIIGRRWCSERDEAEKDKFCEAASDMIRNGQAQQVLNVCHELLGKESDPSSEVAAKLTEMVHQARHSLTASMN
jgi:hypothetical protein